MLVSVFSFRVSCLVSGLVAAVTLRAEASSRYPHIFSPILAKRMAADLKLLLVGRARDEVAGVQAAFIVSILTGVTGFYVVVCEAVDNES